VAGLNRRIPGERPLGLKILGPNAFERSYVLEGSRGEHRPEKVRSIVGRLVGKG
jgi:hypothetical protein